MSDTPEFSQVVLATLAYVNLRVAESLMAGPIDDLGQRAGRARLAGDALARFSSLCDALPGGFAAAQEVLVRAASPVDEFDTMTTPRTESERWFRLAAVTNWEVEFVQALVDRAPDLVPEAAQVSPGLWRRLSAAGEAIKATTPENQSAADALALYGRRLLGEATVLCQRLIVRDEAFRLTIAGEIDEDLVISGRFINELLAAVWARLAKLHPGL